MSEKHGTSAIVSNAGSVIRLACMLMKSADTQLTAKTDLTYSQFKVLYLIEKGDNWSQKTIAEHLDITGAAISRLTETLVRKEYIKRHPNPENKRENMMALTALGKEKLASAWQMLLSAENVLFEDVDKDEVKTFLSVLEQLTHRLEKYPTPETRINKASQ